jgi:hypothetical protein
LRLTPSASASLARAACNDSIDFRDVYATLVRHWLAVHPEPILGKRHGSLRRV